MGLYARGFRGRQTHAGARQNHRHVKIAIKYDDGAFGNSIDKSLIARLQEKSIKVVANEQYSARATDLSSLVLKLKESDADIILSTDYPNDAILFARQSKELGLPTKAVVGWAGIAFPKFRQDLGDYADGMMSINLPVDIDPAVYRQKSADSRRVSCPLQGRRWTRAAGIRGRWLRRSVGFVQIRAAKSKNYDADAIRDAAMAADVPEGGLTMGWGLKFSDGKSSPTQGRIFAPKSE